jgi:hypothetical protein
MHCERKKGDTHGPGLAFLFEECVTDEGRMPAKGTRALCLWACEVGGRDQDCLYSALR